MTSEVKIWMVVSLLMSVSNLRHWADGAPQVPCYFIFGDSLADSGNNNHLPTMAKVNYWPYGIDFPTGPTGRFCNGRTTVDIIAQLLGFDHFIPPFATASGDILKGVNYASGSAGIRKETGSQQGARITMDEQLKNHKIIVSRIVKILGNNESAAKYLSKCIYSVGMGSNDYINNYFMPQFYSTSHQYTPEKYAALLIEQYSLQLRTLYNDGARKVALIGLGQIGCTPAEVAMHGTGGSSCVEKINNAVQLFNQKLKSLVDVLNKNLSNAKFSYLDSFGTASGSVAVPGFRVWNAPCCKVGSSNFTCTPLDNPCPNRNEYVFWDNVHPTEALNVLVGEKYYYAQSLSEAYPYNIQQLAQL